LDPLNIAQCASKCSSGRFFASFVICITLIELCAVTAFGFFVVCAKMVETPEIATTMAVNRARADTMIFTAFLQMALTGFAAA
jgi:hypothetical protein